MFGSVFPAPLTPLVDSFSLFARHPHFLQGILEHLKEGSFDTTDSNRTKVTTPAAITE
jgi:hypothetical protein